MDVRVEVTIDAPRDRVWAAITDFENATKRIRAIETIEILERPSAGLVGLKWRETRTMFGKQATETMWITEAVEPQFYETRAESHGSIYRSRLALDERDGRTVLSMSLAAEPQGFFARIMAATVGRLFLGSTRKALQQDLEDIRRSVESEVQH